MGVLGWVTLLPLFGAILVMLVPREEESIHRGLGLLTALVTFAVSLTMLTGFDAGQAGFQMEVDRLWIAPLGIHFHLGVDGISLWLVLLTTFMVPLTLLSPQAIGIRNIRVREFTAAMLILETGMIGAFLALDLFVFYVFWELMLIPMYFIIGIWGGERRLYASIKFVIYTLVGSLLMLVAILYLYAQWHATTGGHQLRLHAAVAPDPAGRGPSCSASRPSRWRSPSRCQSSRCTPGCRTRTSRRPPAVR